MESSADISEAQIRVLVVDDDCWQRLRVEKRLRLEGYATKGARNGLEALAYMREEPLDLIILDMYMAGMSGLDVLRLKGKEERIADIPVIVLSGMNDQATRIEGLSEGAYDYLDKERLVEEELLAKAKNHIRGFRNQRSLKIQAEQIDDLRRKATIDSLTELPNRSYFKERWDDEVKRAQRHHHFLSAAMLDIDHFKQINDTYGHAMGDVVLGSLARLIRSCLRKEDIAGRLGGEEFAIAFPHLDTIQAAAAAERLREAVEHTTLAEGLSCTVSIGVASSDKYHFDELIEAADGALYVAKRGGRNKVESAKGSGHAG